MNETDVKKAAKKIQNAQTFQELHDIMFAYADNYNSENAPTDPPAYPTYFPKLNTFAKNMKQSELEEYEEMFDKDEEKI